ncbi:MAG TPA: UvrD-helicase domain-containing protein [Polyangia bacterium]|nr:UvrD-helicase domain-containing protein [Polyangia bacterium]
MVPDSQPLATPPAAHAPTVSLVPREVTSGPFSREALARELNPAQLAAVVHPGQPLLVVAGAGSGKTRVITYRLARLVAAGGDPRRVLAVTFTNKAAGELRERVGKLLGPRMGLGTAGLWVGTFHSISARLLRQWGQAVGLLRDFVIYDDDDQKRLLGRVLTDLKVPERLFPVRQVLSAIDRAKNQGITAKDFQPGDYFDDVVAKAYALYEERLAASNATDFGGLLMSALQLCAADVNGTQEILNRFDHVLVDEFQDTNSVQYRLVRYLSRRTGSITVVGDEDQSIYKWRGADIRNILDFERDHGGAQVVKLEQNYRSTGNILRAANAIIERNTERRPKRLFTESGDGSPIVMFEGETERDEADFVAARIEASLQEGASPRDFAVFYRTNAQSRVLEDALRARDLPYVIVGGTRFFDRAEIKDLICYLRALSNPDDGMALQRIINVPTRGIGGTTVDRITDLIYEKKISAWAALAAATEDPEILGTGPRKKVAAFVEFMTRLRSEGAGLGPAALAEKVLEESGYRDALAAESSLEAEGRIENLLELIAQMREYEKEAEEPSLSGFLERIALASDVDGYDPEKGAVSLMTVHTAKGLEFPTVFITGLEERIFPHARSVDDDSAVEEERRLCYVAVTRARKFLTLSRVRRRRLSGQELPGVPSRFLKELPAACIEAIVMERPAGYYGDSEGQGPWGGRWSRDDDGGRERGWNASGGGNGGGFSAPRRGPAARPTAAASPARKAATGEIVVDYDHEAEPSGLQIGAKLRHSQFGVGEVRGWQAAGADMKVTMRFPSVGVKTILARFLTK